ncbi:MAG: hypothetical protein ACKO2V_23295 [Snowella sp.]
MTLTSRLLSLFLNSDRCFLILFESAIAVLLFMNSAIADLVINLRKAQH